MTNKSKSKSDYLKEIYYIRKTKNFYYFLYGQTSNYQDFAKILREISLNQFKLLHLPSSFQLVKDYTIQGPRIGILYTSNINLKRFHFLIKLKGISFKMEKKWYSPILLDSLRLYKKEKDLVFQFLYIIEINCKV